uniref:Uncharacterized protein n=1 Tax=Anguilla anguilla TaxID=7936 RepID=A0A0E9RTA1_ANGAN
MLFWLNGSKSLLQCSILMPVILDEMLGVWCLRTFGRVL